MDPSRIESYLRSTCCVLDFDIGELWSARKLPGQSPELKFIQLYTSPTYEDFHSLLLQPDQASLKDEDMHRFSPVICRGVCDGGQIVWANTRISQGLTGRTELPLNTAVGVPICSIGYDTYILVLFAVELIPMTPQSIEYLATVSRAVTEGSNTFLSPSFTHGASITKAKTEDFVGIWDIGELIKKYSSEVEFHLLPIGKLQKYFDCNEILLFCDFFTDFKTRRDGRFTVKQLESLRDSYKMSRLRSDSVSSLSSKGWETSGVGQAIANAEGGTSQNESQLQPQQQRQQYVMGNANADINNAFDENPGVYNVDITAIDDIGLPIDDPPHHHLTASTSSNNLNNSSSNDINNNQLVKAGRSDEADNSVLHIYAHMTYKLSQSRFHEFMIAILGMTVFESSELWLVAERESELFLVAGVYRNVNMQKWISFNENIRLRIGASGPGRIVATSGSHWEMNYATVCDDHDPRKAAARQYNINTSFGVPIQGIRGVCGALMFYSSRQNFAAEPLLILLVERAVQLIAMSNLEAMNFSNPDNAGDPSQQPASATLTRWLLEDDPNNPTMNSSSVAGVQGYAPPNYPHTVPSSYDPNQYQLQTQLQGMNLPRSFTNVDYQQKLEMVRNIVNSKEFTPLPYPPEQQQPPHQQQPLQPNTAQPSASVSSLVPPHLQQLPNQSNTSHMLSPHDLQRMNDDAEVSAAYALANIGKVHWKNFLEGSNNGARIEGGGGGVAGGGGYGGLKLESNKMLAMYDENQGGGAGGVGSSSSQNLPKCKVDDCNACVENATVSYCANHRHMRRCQKEGCNKCAQGATKYCIAHGGGRRCTFPGCFKGARDKFFCAAHGGGKRCTFEGCSKSAVGGSNLCTAHGGGKRCQFPGCNKSSQSSTRYCVRHGGGRTCSYPDCNKVARGKTEFCASHGGGVRCKLKGCNRLAVSAQQLCRTHSQQLSGGKPGDDGFSGEDEDYGDDDDDMGSVKSGEHASVDNPTKKQKLA